MLRFIDHSAGSYTPLRDRGSSAKELKFYHLGAGTVAQLVSLLGTFLRDLERDRDSGFRRQLQKEYT
jgi:hypothetical protein